MPAVSDSSSHIATMASELGITSRQVSATVNLLADGSTIPFIARYRKEWTDSLDEVAVAAIRDRHHQLMELDARREAILKSLSERDLLTPQLSKSLETVETLSALEDLYLPHRPKRRTRAMIAREMGLGPLAKSLGLQKSSTDPMVEAARFVNIEKEVITPEDALAGARDILAEEMCEDPAIRERMRSLFRRLSTISSKLIKKNEDQKFRDYFDWSEPARKAPSHRILAMYRGENSDVLKVSIRPPENDALALLEKLVVSGSSRASKQVALAAKDGYKRLLAPSLETEIRKELKERADRDAINVFVSNFREMLLTAPFGRKRVLALDPGFRTGCKTVALDAQGKLLAQTVVFPHNGKDRAEQAATTLVDLCNSYDVQAIAVGNGTAGRETEEFVRGLNLAPEIEIIAVDERGASVYSASEIARSELPDQDVTTRGAVSIGRRLMDPLSELVKIDPKSIGVGQYQHDVDQSMLKAALDDVVASAVNSVGVEVNTASSALLTYVSGLGPQLAANVVKHRDANGPFRTIKELLKVPRLGPKAFEQAAGFLRILNGSNPLDASAVHPERYGTVEKMARDVGTQVGSLITDAALREKIVPSRYVSDDLGLPTLTDILLELERPGRDPRDRYESFSFAAGISEIDDVSKGMNLPGIVTNVTDFGAFVDIGVHQDGLVHISQLADRFIKHPSEVVKVGQKVMVSVVEVDLERKRIALSCKAR